MKTKILHLITGLELGGAEAALCRTVRKMAGFEHIICSLSDKGELGKQMEKGGFRVYELKSGKKFSPAAVFRFWRIILKEKPDILITYLVHADIFGRIFGRIFIKKIICYLRSELNDKKFRLFLKLEKLTSFLVNSYLAVSDSVKETYVKNCGIKPEKITVIPNGVELEKFKIAPQIKEELKKQLNIANNFPVIGSVGKLRPEKNYGGLITAFSKLAAEFPGARLLLAGDGPEKSALVKLAAELEISDKVLFLGNRKDIPELLSVMDFFILASVFEGLSNALLEALAAGLPIIASDIPANTGVVKDGYNGYLINPRDPDAIAKKMIYLCQNKNLLPIFADNSSALSKHFSLDRALALLEEFLCSKI